MPSRPRPWFAHPDAQATAGCFLLLLFAGLVLGGLGLLGFLLWSLL